MTLQPASLADLSRLLADCHAARRPVTAVDLASLADVREYTPEDMTVTVEGGMSVAELQDRLAAHGQWLPIDPPRATCVTVRQLLSENLSGPRRCGFGTIREHLIGLEAVLADGRVTHSGGRVVKNVAGYDVLKLFVGARDSLGIISAATFKLRPLPAQELILCARFGSLAAACSAAEAILNSSATPIILDLHNLAPDGTTLDVFTVVVGFSGTHQEVEWQRGMADGFESPATPLDYEGVFWSAEAPVQTISILPSQLPETLSTLGSIPFVARAANGIIHHRGTASPRPAAETSAVAQRLKATFDPHHILPAAPL